jgi:hypothetical protein
MKPGFENYMNYIQYKVVDCRGEDTIKYKKEIEDAFEKIDKRYSDQKITTPEKRLEYQNICAHYVLYSGNTPFKYVKVKYV